MSFTPLLVHRFQQVGRAADVVLVVLQRDLNRFAHRLEAGKVDHRIDFFLPEQQINRFGVAQVGQVKLDVFAGQFLHPAQGIGFGVAEVVDDHDLVARFEQFDAGVGADVAGAAGDEDGFAHGRILLTFRG